MKKPLKLYVWEDVLRSYSAGIAFTLAENPAQARKIILKHLGEWNHSDFAKEPIEVKTKRAFVIYGGD